MIDFASALTIVGMGVITYSTRLIGYFALRNRRFGPRAVRVMDAAPGCVIAAVIAPHRRVFLRLFALAAAGSLKIRRGVLSAEKIQIRFHFLTQAFSPQNSEFIQSNQNSNPIGTRIPCKGRGRFLYPNYTKLPLPRRFFACFCTKVVKWQQNIIGESGSCYPRTAGKTPRNAVSDHTPHQPTRTRNPQ